MTTAPVAARLAAADPSARLAAALAAGTAADPGDAEALVDRCAVEPDFFVRDMLTWALTRLPADRTVPLLLAALGSAAAQARSQALHTLSKIGDPRAWPAVRGLVHDPVDEVARAAWRAAAVLAPAADRPSLAADLLGELGRGDAERRRSLGRALVALGEEVVRPLLADAERLATPAARAHAAATLRLLDDPDADVGAALPAARRAAAVGRGPIPGEPC